MPGSLRSRRRTLLVLSLLVIGLCAEDGFAVERTKKEKTRGTATKTPDTRVHWVPTDTSVPPAGGSSRADTSSPSDTTIVSPAIRLDTASTDTQSADTHPVDTQPYTARPGGRFYHKRSLGHSPQLGEKGALVANDTALLSDTFSACPICFQSPITEEDFELEEAIANQVAGIVEFRYRKLDDDTVAHRLNRIGHSLTPILDRNHLEFFFTPLRSSLEKNAISAGNGYVYFTSGLIDILEDDDEVAAVLAHEICHAEFRHVLQDFKLSQKLTLVTAVLSAVVNRSSNVGGVFQVLQDYAASLVMNGFSRQFELEADAGAKWVLESQGHDTNAMRRVLLKLEDLYPDRPERSSLMATHPEESDRIKAFDQTIIFNRTSRGDTLAMRLKFQRPRSVGWFKERAVPALYATLINETDSPLYVTDMTADYKAADLPQVKVEVSPGSLMIPENSYAQIKILVISKTELARTPTAVDFACSIKRPDEPPARSKSHQEKKKPERISFHFDLTHAGQP